MAGVIGITYTAMDRAEAMLKRSFTQVTRIKSSATGSGRRVKNAFLCDGKTIIVRSSCLNDGSLVSLGYYWQFGLLINLTICWLLVMLIHIRSL